MRKTLPTLVLVLAAGSLAACKMPWDKPKDPEPVATAPQTPTPDLTTVTEPPKPVEQAAVADPAKPAVTPVPAAK